MSSEQKQQVEIETSVMNSRMSHSGREHERKREKWNWNSTKWTMEESLRQARAWHEKREKEGGRNCMKKDRKKTEKERKRKKGERKSGSKALNTMKSQEKKKLRE